VNDPANLKAADASVSGQIRSKRRKISSAVTCPQVKKESGSF